MIRDPDVHNDTCAVSWSSTTAEAGGGPGCLRGDITPVSDLRDARGLSRTWCTQNTVGTGVRDRGCEWRAKECSFFLVEEDVGMRGKAQGSVIPAPVPEL